MRNLKKILAMVLALVMSLSLMAVAGAKDFTDKSDINAEYQAAVDVLNGLEVFRGYQDGSFQPKGDITRAEVATIIYRIATADVTDAQAGIYTTWGKFDDVKDTSWYAGYVNYCANAGIVHGKTPAGVTPAIFDPEARITGYQVLAMILRTIGYGKNGEFEGTNWAINTAAQAKQLGIIDGVTENLLGSNATREFVAQILFKTILTSEVDYSILEGYKPNGKTLAKEKFGMERIEGVVIANEYADLRDGDVEDEGKTVLRTADGDVTMNVSTDLNDIGETRYAYVVSDGKRSNTLVTGELYKGNDVVVETGDAATVSSFASKEAGLSVSEAQHFVNFDYEIVGESEYRIEYQVSFNNNKVYDNQTAQDWFADEYGVDPADVIDDDNRRDDVKVDPLDSKKVTYTRVIPMGDPITVEDVAIMKGIFSAADDDIHTDVGVSGYVYAGTAKNTSKEQHDLSSEMSWRAFQEEYLVSKADTTVKSTANGEWLKIIDNDNDGMAEYVFKTEYYLDEIVGYNNRTGKFRFNHITLGDANYADGYEPAIGDVVLGALIDGVWQIELAPMETKTIQTVNFKSKNVVTTDGDTWDQSGIFNETEYADQILEMGQKTEYEIFFDKFDHVRAYRSTKGASDYALLSELYFENQYNTAIIKNYTPIVEITIKDEDTVELPVSNATNSNPSVFDGVAHVITDSRGRQHTDYLQRAINHLGVSNTWKDKFVSYFDNNNNIVYRDEFQWNTTASTKWEDRVSETNVAAYTLTDDGESVSLGTASAFKYDRQGKQMFYSDLDEDGTVLKLDDRNANTVNETEYRARHALAVKNGTLTSVNGTVSANEDTAFGNLTPVYAIDYVQLDEANGVSKGAVRYNIHAADCSYNLYGTLINDTRYDGNYVNATHNTQYYIVSIDGSGRASSVNYFTDYANLPAISADKISAMYAVASNTRTDRDGRDYWVAEVIVIETTGTDKSYDSVALAYYSPEKSSGGIHSVEALDNMSADPAVNLTRTTSWNPSNYQWDGYGFYELYDVEGDESDLTVGDMTKIPESAKGYNDHGIHAAVVTRNARVQGEGDYIMIDRTGHTYGDKNDEIRLNVNDKIKVYGIYHNTKDETKVSYPVYLLDEMDVDELTTGDEIIYVRDKWNDSLQYIVVTNYVRAAHDDYVNTKDWSNAKWLQDDYDEILVEQNPDDDRDEAVIYFNLAVGEEVTVTCEGDKYTIEGDDDIATPDEMTLKVSNVVDFTFELDLSKVVALAKNAPYKFLYTATDDPDVVIVRAYDSTVVKPLTANDEKTIEVGTAYTVAAVKEIKDAATKSLENATPAEIAKVDALANLLLEVKVSLIPESSTAADLEAEVIEAVVVAKVNVVVAERGVELTDEERTQIENAVKEAVENAEAAEDLKDVIAEVDKAAEDKTEEIKPSAYTVTLEATNGVITKVSAEYTVKNEVYTIEADTDAVIVVTITSEEELDATAPVTVTADGKTVTLDAENIVLGEDKKTVTVTLPAVTADVNYKFTLKTAAK